MRIRSGSSTRAAALAICAGAAACFGALPARADQDVQSSDGMWKLHAKIDGSLAVGKSAEALVDVAPMSAMGKGCPDVSSVAFVMPAHGHGGKVDPSVMAMGNCQFHVTNISPSMGGAWTLHLVLKSGGKSSDADFSLTAK